MTPPIRDILFPYLLFPIDTQCSTQEIVVRDLPIGDLLCPYPAVSHRHPQFIITLIEGWYVGMPKIYHHLIVQPVNKYAGDGVIRMNNNVIHQIAFGFEQAL